MESRSGILEVTPGACDSDRHIRWPENHAVAHSKNQSPPRWGRELMVRIGESKLYLMFVW